MVTRTIAIGEPKLGQAALCEPLLRLVGAGAPPEWFGIEDTLDGYVEEIDGLPTLLALDGRRAIGFLTLKQHNDFAAEIHAMAVAPEMQRRGIGRMLVEAAEVYLWQHGVEYLHVKTLSPAHTDHYSAQTRAFFCAVGFRPLAEFPAVRGDYLPMIMLVKKVDVQQEWAE